MTKQNRTLSLSAAIALLLISGSAAAQSISSSGLEQVGRSVSDEDLADMRGKFISPSNISYFGLQMQTSWQGTDGITTNATLLFSVEFLGGAGNPDGAVPVLMIGWNRDGDPSMDVAGLGEAAAPGYVAIAVPQGLAIGGLGSVQGAVQSQQIAGSDNRGRNDMRVAIVPAWAVKEGSASGLQAVTAGESHQFASGDSLQFVVANNELGLLVDGGADGQVAQSFNGNIGQAAQHIILNGSGNSVVNGMGITIGYDQIEQANRVNIQNALSTLKGMGL